MLDSMRESITATSGASKVSRASGSGGGKPVLICELASSCFSRHKSRTQCFMKVPSYKMKPV